MESALSTGRLVASFLVCRGYGARLLWTYRHTPALGVWAGAAEELWPSPIGVSGDTERSRPGVNFPIWLW